MFPIPSHPRNGHVGRVFTALFFTTLVSCTSVFCSVSASIGHSCCTSHEFRMDSENQFSSSSSASGVSMIEGSATEGSATEGSATDGSATEGSATEVIKESSSAVRNGDSTGTWERQCNPKNGRGSSNPKESTTQRGGSVSGQNKSSSVGPGFTSK